MNPPQLMFLCHHWSVLQKHFAVSFPLCMCPPNPNGRHVLPMFLTQTCNVDFTALFSCWKMFLSQVMNLCPIADECFLFVALVIEFNQEFAMLSWQQIVLPASRAAVQETQCCTVLVPQPLDLFCPNPITRGWHKRVCAFSRVNKGTLRLTVTAKSSVRVQCFESQLGDPGHYFLCDNMVWILRMTLCIFGAKTDNHIRVSQQHVPTTMTSLFEKAEMRNLAHETTAVSILLYYQSLMSRQS